MVIAMRRQRLEVLVVALRAAALQKGYGGAKVRPREGLGYMAHRWQGGPGAVAEAMVLATQLEGWALRSPEAISKIAKCLSSLLWSRGAPGASIEPTGGETKSVGE